MLLNIITDPNPILHRIAKTLTLKDIKSEEIQNLIKQMTPTMHLKDGVGLAATQVGRLLQICIIHKNHTSEKNKDLILINPTWKKIGIFTNWDEEGCLSVPNTWGEIKRYSKIKVSALDQDGRPLTFTAANFLARIIQHEVDHMHGVLFISKAKNLHLVYKE